VIKETRKVKEIEYIRDLDAKANAKTIILDDGPGKVGYKKYLSIF